MCRPMDVGEAEAMTEYFHGRPVRVARRRRSPLVIAVVALAATLVWLYLADASSAVGNGDPALTGLDGELATRFVEAQEAAAGAGVELTLTSGKRSAAEQQALVDAALKRYGSKAEAHRWVLPADSSAHVKGLALDVGPTAGARWLGKHGLEFGLCRTYANEVWHFEKLPEGRDTCPKQHDDSSWGW
jgi:zinc D-Ala-D-Ala carboxypeptidase